MKRVSYSFVVGLASISVWAGAAVGQNSTASSSQNTPTAGQSSVSTVETPQEPSLGSYARAVRKSKQQAVKQFDNDNIPRSDTISVVGDKSEAADQAADSSDDTQAQANAASQDKMPKVTPGQSQAERQKVYDQWQQKISDQQGQIDQMAHELDLNQREYRLRAAAFYADAGNRLRNEADWDKEDADYKQKIADQQKALDDAKQKLSDLHEDARKAGVPESAQQPEASDNSAQ